MSNNEIYAQPSSKSTEPSDTLPKQDTITVKKEAKQGETMKFAADTLDAPVTYSAKDSIIYDVTNGKVFLYGGAKIEQNDIALRANRLIFDQNAKIVDAQGSTDSTGQLIGRPVFTDKTQEFRANQLTYNFESKKGKISELVTKEGEGFLRGEKVKKNEHDELFAKNAYYTTCNLEHPHFKIKVNKVKVIPNKLIVSGPAHLVIQDVPTPLILPFGIFPIQKGQTSGIVLPTYGFSPNQGYYLRGGGYYFGFSDYFDLALTGDIFTNGSWRTEAGIRYAKRYKFDGRFSVNYGHLQVGDPLVRGSGITKNFQVEWRHAQDGKARPNSNFSSNVTFGTSTFNREFEATNPDVLTNTLTSSISYGQRFPGTPFSLNISARHNQQLNTNIVRLTLPDLTLTMARQFPFKRKVSIGGQKWYERIGINSALSSRAELSIADSLLFTKEAIDEIQHGIQHTANLSTDLNLFKYIKVNPSIRYTGVGYFETTRKQWIGDTTYTETDTIAPHVSTISRGGFKAGAEFSSSVSMSTRFFGIFNFKKGRLKALRHEITPSLSFNYRPDFSKSGWNYYQEITDASGNVITDPSLRSEIGSDTLYSVFSNGIYGGPSSSEQASISFSLNNVLQAKIHSSKDTTESKEKKIKLLDRLRIGSSYNFAAERRKLAPFQFSAGTNIFNKLNFDISGTLDPYAIDANGVALDDFEWDVNRRLLRLRSMNLNFNTTLKSTDFGGKKKQPNLRNRLSRARGSEQEREEVRRNPDAFMDFNLPWNLRFDYTLRLNRTRSEGENVNTVTQTINFGGDFSLTPKWKVSYNSGYDFTNKEFARTTINIYRDLHCWEMSFFISPFGQFKRYEYTLRVKSSVLQDLKLTRKRYWRDL